MAAKNRDSSKPEEQKPRDKYAAPALEKGLDILEMLAGTETPMSRVQIARSLGRNPNETYRMLSTLVRRRYLVESPDGDRFHASLKLLTLANSYPARQRLRETAEPLMRMAARNTGQSCHLAFFEDGNVVVDIPIVTPGIWRWSLRAGAHLGIYNSGSGQTLLAFQEREIQKRMIEDHRLVDGEEPVKQSAFFERLDQIRDAGFFRAPSVTVEGMINMSFPVLDELGNAMFVLTCPFLNIIDTSDAPNVDEVFDIYREIASQIGSLVSG